MLIDPRELGEHADDLLQNVKRVIIFISVRFGFLIEKFLSNFFMTIQGDQINGFCYDWSLRNLGKLGKNTLNIFIESVLNG